LEFVTIFDTVFFVLILCIDLRTPFTDNGNHSLIDNVAWCFWAECNLCYYVNFLMTPNIRRDTLVFSQCPVKKLLNFVFNFQFYTRVLWNCMLCLCSETAAAVELRHSVL